MDQLRYTGFNKIFTLVFLLHISASEPININIIVGAWGEAVLKFNFLRNIACTLYSVCTVR